MSVSGECQGKFKILGEGQMMVRWSGEVKVRFKSREFSEFDMDVILKLIKASTGQGNLNFTLSSRYGKG